MRAKEIRKLFPEIPEERIRLFGKLSDASPADSTLIFLASKINSAVNNENVKEIDESAMIYFPYNSTSKLKNEKIDKYLDEVAARLKKTGEKVSLVGHTDSFGPEDTNYNLGLKRANVIKNILVSKGVPADRITVESKGEKSPLVPNNSRENRAKNRRVELKIIK
ncbi:MAG TPA: OmpA family protein [Bacteroidetes bacterium]|nr:OmpA family protein [Bacteroidota bacterium]